MFRWERNMARPQIRYFPQILKFLGYDPFPFPVSLADKLRAARRRLGLTQTAFAEQLGVDPTTLRKWEQDKAQPNRRSLKIIKKFNCRIRSQCSVEDQKPRDITRL